MMELLRFSLSLTVVGVMICTTCTAQGTGENCVSCSTNVCAVLPVFTSGTGGYRDCCYCFGMSTDPNGSVACFNTQREYHDDTDCCGVTSSAVVEHIGGTRLATAEDTSSFAQCSTSTYGPGVDTSGLSTGPTDGTEDMQYFLPDTPFTCSGTIDQLEIVLGDQNGQFSLQLWRPYVNSDEELSDLFEMVDESQELTATNVMSLFTPMILSSGGGKLQFQTGDILGFRVPSTSSDILRVQSSGSGMHHRNEPTSCAEFKNLFHRVSDNEQLGLPFFRLIATNFDGSIPPSVLPPPSTPNTPTSTSTAATSSIVPTTTHPLLAPSSTATPTGPAGTATDSTTSSTDETPSSPISLPILIGTVAGVVVIILLLVVLVIMIVCLARSPGRNKMMKLSTLSSPSHGIELQSAHHFNSAFPKPRQTDFDLGSGDCEEDFANRPYDIPREMDSHPPNLPTSSGVYDVPDELDRGPLKSFHNPLPTVQRAQHAQQQRHRSRQPSSGLSRDSNGSYMDMHPPESFNGRDVYAADDSHVCYDIPRSAQHFSGMQRRPRSASYEPEDQMNMQARPLYHILEPINGEESQRGGSESRSDSQATAEQQAIRNRYHILEPLSQASTSYGDSIDKLEHAGGGDHYRSLDMNSIEDIHTYSSPLQYEPGQKPSDYDNPTALIKKQTNETGERPVGEMDEPPKRKPFYYTLEPLHKDRDHQPSDYREKSIESDRTMNSRQENPHYDPQCRERDPVTGHHYHMLVPEDSRSYVSGGRVEYDHGLYVPTAEERRQFSDSGSESFYTRWAKLKRHESTKRRAYFEESDSYWDPGNSYEALYDQFAKKKFREILREDIQIIEHLGAGQFGSVCKGTLNFNENSVDVAVKMMKPTALKSQKVKFLREAAIMGQFFHPNIVKLKGIVSIGDPVMIVLELMVLGDLLDYLRKHRPEDGGTPLSAPRLLSFSKDIACGMKYLEKKGFVHRDLAARNILLSESLICKIADFGMSRDLEESDYYKMTNSGTIPVKWTAPEALNYHRFSSSSDVYSYGMTLFEVWSLGERPLAEIENAMVAHVTSRGYCQSPPPGCPRAIYHLMVQCWNPSHDERPTFADVYDYLNASDDTLLAWSAIDREISKGAAHIGAPLSESSLLYKDLQQNYIM